MKIKILSKLKFNLPSEYLKVEQDENLILLDIFNKNDLDLCQAIKLDPKTAHTPIIILVNNLDYVIGSGADDYIAYPFEIQEIEIRIKLSFIRAHKKSLNHLDQINLDLLTGLYNKHYFYSCCEEAIKYSKFFSIIMIDLDSFKEINDSYGHLKGDEMLKELAKLFKYSIRNNDILARFGGDEFILMLPDTDAQGAHVVGERIRQLVESRCRVSVGIAGLEFNDTLEDIIDRADKALYEAKKQGGNKVN